MEKKICPICGEEISATDRQCPYCDERLDSYEVQSASSVGKKDSCASIAIEGNSGTLTYSKGLVGLLVGITLIGMILDISELIMPNSKVFDDSTESFISAIGSIMEGVGMFALLFMYGRKITSDGIREVSNGLVMTAAALAAVSGLLSIADSEGAMLLTLMTLAIYLIVWIIVGVQSVKVEMLKQIGIWMIISIVLSAIVIAISIISGGGGKAFARLMFMLYGIGYVKMFDYLKKYLCSNK